jgi:HK97 family phage portal protein
LGIFSWLVESRWLNGDKLERSGNAWWAPNPKTSDFHVTEQNALQISTVYACIRIISETIASLPINVYKRGKDGSRDKDTDHPLFKVLHDEANSEMSAFSFWETMVSHVLTWGNAYAEIERNGAGKVVALWPLSPELVTVDRRNKQLIYRVSIDNKKEIVLPPEKVLHFHGLGYDGRIGYSPIAMQRETLAFAKSTELYGHNFFRNGAKPGGVLEMDGILKDKEARDRLRESWHEIHGGSGNSHRVAILEAGLKYKPISLAPEDAQFLETRRWSKEEIAQLYRVPLHMLNDLQRATFSNIEHQSIEFVVHTIRPHLVRMEQEIKRKAFSEGEKANYFAEWLVDGLLRGDAESRNKALQIQRQNGIINANEWRAIENMNPQEGEQGKAYLVNSAMIGINQALIQEAPKGGDTTNGERNANGGSDTTGGTES